MIYNYAKSTTQILNLITSFYCCSLDRIISLRKVWESAQEKEKWFLQPLADDVGWLFRQKQSLNIFTKASRNY